MRALISTIVLALVLSCFTAPARVWAACMGSSPNWTAETWPTDVNTCYRKAKNGDTITVAAGTFTSTAPVALESGKSVTLRGSGSIPSQGAATSGGTTVVVNNTGGLTAALGITESTAGHIVLRNITFTTDSAKSTPSFGIIVVNERVPGGKPVVIDHVTIDFTDKVNFSPFARTAVLSAASRGVVSNSIFTGQAPGSATDYITNRAALDCKRNNPSDNWSTAHTMGTADTTGFNNLYFETNTVEFFNDAIDHSDGCRLVNRYNTFRNSTAKGHGADSGYGARHFEHYNNTWECVVGVQGNMPYWIFQRGGTGVITDNVFPTIGRSTCGFVQRGSTTSVGAQIFRLTQNISTHCWPTEPVTSITRSGSTATLTTADPHGLSDGQKIHVYGAAQRAYNVIAATVTVTGAKTLTYTVSGTPATPATGTITFVSQAHAIYPGSYPAIRQIGWGWTRGATKTRYETFAQDLEPTYIWNNTGMASANTITPLDAGADLCQNGLTTATFFQQDREWISSAKSGYTKYRYPHPLVPSDGDGSGGAGSGRRGP